MRAAQFGLIFMRGSRSREPALQTMLDRARTSSGQSDVEHVDPERFHQVKDFNLLGNSRIADRRRLQTVAQ